MASTFNYESKYTNRNPTQLPTTPMAEYELVNMSGRNSNRLPNIKLWNKEQYAIKGIERAMYKNEKRSSKKILGCGELFNVSLERLVAGRPYAGARRSNASRNNTSQKIVYTVFTGNSAAVNRSGKRETWPATANGLKAPKNLRSWRAIKLKGMMTRRIAFSWTCQPKRKDA
jgi:hypothetical protein